MKHVWSGVAAAAMMSLTAAASAQTPLSPSGAVNNREAPSITFPSAAPSRPAAPPKEAASRPTAEPATPAPSAAPIGTASTPAGPAATDATTAPSAAPEGGAASNTTAGASSERERGTAVSRPKRPTPGAEDKTAQASRSERSARYPGDDVADMLNARELSRLDGAAGPAPVARPMGPPPVYMPPPPYPRPPIYAAPPGYPPPPPPPVLMRPPY